MAKRVRDARPSEGVKVRGCLRMQLVEGGKVVGDSGWRENTIVDLGFDQYLCQRLTGAAGGKNVTHIAVGTGTAPNATHTTLNGELASRVTASTSTIASKTAQFTAQFASSVFSTQGAQTIQNVGLFNTSSGGTIFSGTTYTTSQWNTNQDLNVTYQIRFS